MNEYEQLTNDMEKEFIINNEICFFKYNRRMSKLEKTKQEIINAEIKYIENMGMMLCTAGEADIISGWSHLV